MLKFAVLIFPKNFVILNYLVFLKPTEVCGRNDNVSVVPYCVASLLSEQLRKSLIERVHWIYKCVYVSLRMGASVNLVLSKPVDWVTD